MIGAFLSLKGGRKNFLKKSKFGSFKSKKFPQLVKCTLAKVGKTCIAITNLPPRAMMGIDSCGMLISAVHHEEGVEKLHLLMVDPHIPAGAKLY